MGAWSTWDRCSVGRRIFCTRAHQVPRHHVGFPYDDLDGWRVIYPGHHSGRAVLRRSTRLAKRASPFSTEHRGPGVHSLNKESERGCGLAQAAGSISGVPRTRFASSWPATRCCLVAEGPPSARPTSTRSERSPPKRCKSPGNCSRSSAGIRASASRHRITITICRWTSSRK